MQYLQKKKEDEVDFLPAVKHKSFLQVDNISLVCVARHSQSNQSSKFGTSLQYLKENVKDEVPAENHKRFLQIDTIILGVWPGMPSLPKITSLLLLCDILREK